MFFRRMQGKRHQSGGGFGGAERGLDGIIGDREGGPIPKFRAGQRIITRFALPGGKPVQSKGQIGNRNREAVRLFLEQGHFRTIQPELDRFSAVEEDAEIAADHIAVFRSDEIQRGDWPAGIQGDQRFIVFPAIRIPHVIPMHSHMDGGDGLHTAIERAQLNATDSLRIGRRQRTVQRHAVIGRNTACGPVTFRRAGPGAAPGVHAPSQLAAGSRTAHFDGDPVVGSGVRRAGADAILRDGNVIILSIPAFPGFVLKENGKIHRANGLR